MSAVDATCGIVVESCPETSEAEIAASDAHVAALEEQAENALRIAFRKPSLNAAVNGIRVTLAGVRARCGARHLTVAS